MVYKDSQHDINKKFKKLEEKQYGKKTRKRLDKYLFEAYEGYSEQETWDYIEYIYEHDNDNK
ncbi:hypothetical protein NST17_19695 [Caldifermentibacillus hisashii]|uniref:Uncharacterized protein n=1 Tax=Caldifermentibacillus hisashii TaxID=996558 RepID=A0ABU9K2T5_9BACI